MRRISLVAALAACIALVAAPASAAHAPVGDRLDLFEPCLAGSIDPQPADTAFHVLHGWAVEPGGIDNQAIGRFRFDLSIDGEDLKGKLIVERNRDGGDLAMTRRYLFSFPDGLSAGTYTFDYEWTSPDEILECTLDVEFTG